MTLLEQEFLAQVTKNANEAKLVCGWNPEHFLNILQKRGAVRCVQEQVRRGGVSEGFESLAQKGRLDLSLEAAVTSAKFADLFDDEAVNYCLELLCEQGYFKI